MSAENRAQTPEELGRKKPLHIDVGKHEFKRPSNVKKIVIPKNIISFQPSTSGESTEKPAKANIVRKVYVRQSRDLIKRVAAESIVVTAEPDEEALPEPHEKGDESNRKHLISRFKQRVD